MTTIHRDDLRCIGQLWGNLSHVEGRHAANVVVNADHIIRVIEPQTDQLRETNEADHCDIADI